MIALDVTEKMTKETSPKMTQLPPTKVTQNLTSAWALPVLAWPHPSFAYLTKGNIVPDQDQGILVTTI